MNLPAYPRAIPDPTRERLGIVEQANEQHSILTTVALHLLPGVLVTLVYALLAQPMQRLGFNNLFTLNLVALLVLVPVEMGILLSVGKQKTGRFTMKGVVLYREPLPVWQLLGLAFLVIVWTVACFILIQPRIDPMVQKTLFGWVPDWFVLMNGFTEAPRNIAILTIALSIVCTSWIAPFVEEYYFRGYLLPRLSRFGTWGAVINAVLFTLYHFFTPWQFVTRVVALIPMVWIVQRKRNIYISIIAHLLLNTLSILPTLIGLLASHP